MKKPVNFRSTVPRCCLGCHYRISLEVETLYEHTEQTSVCKRDETIGLDDSPEFTVCDGYRKPTEEK